jgi:hypothetical protein
MLGIDISYSYPLFFMPFCLLSSSMDLDIGLQFFGDPLDSFFCPHCPIVLDDI